MNDNYMILGVIALMLIALVFLAGIEAYVQIAESECAEEVQE